MGGRSIQVKILDVTIMIDLLRRLKRSVTSILPLKSPKVTIMIDLLRRLKRFAVNQGGYF